MGNSLTKEVLIQVPSIISAREFYVTQLGFEVSEEIPAQKGRHAMISISGEDTNLYIVEGEPIGAVLEVRVENPESTRDRIVAQGGSVVRWDVNGHYIRDPFGLTYHLAQNSS